MQDFTWFNIPYVYDGHDSALRNALKECEEYCVAGCCGFDAFNVTSKNMQRWADRVPNTDVDDARRQTAEILTLLKDAPKEFFFLDWTHSREEVAEWFETIQESLAEVKPGRPAPSK